MLSFFTFLLMRRKLKAIQKSNKRVSFLLDFVQTAPMSIQKVGLTTVTCISYLEDEQTWFSEQEISIFAIKSIVYDTLTRARYRLIAQSDETNDFLPEDFDHNYGGAGEEEGRGN